MKISTYYHDYVFKKGRFIGKFEDMYRHSSEIPWHQDKTAYSVFSDIDIAILKQFKYESICEIGCGLGYFSKRLCTELRSNHGKPEVTGVDVSETAIKKARSLFPKIRFVKGNLLGGRILKNEYFDLVVLKQTLWYVCHDLEKFLQAINSMISEKGYLYVTQSFPGKSKWVGQDVISGPENLKEILTQYAKPVFYCLERDCNFNGWSMVHFLGRSRKSTGRKA